MMRRPETLAILLALACGGGCGGSAAVAGDSTSPTDAVSARPLSWTAEVADGASQLDPWCSEGAPEACDAVDNDCNGVIDDGCGYEGAPLQVTMAWNTDADLDLAVEGPGEPSQDHDGRGGCIETAGQSFEHARGARIVNARWAAPMPGTYRIAVRHADACGSEGTTTASVSVSAAGRVLGTFNVAVEPGAETPAVALTARE